MPIKITIDSLLMYFELMYMQSRDSCLPRDNEILECPLSRGTLASTDNVLVKNDHSHIRPQE